MHTKEPSLITLISHFAATSSNKEHQYWKTPLSLKPFTPTAITHFIFHENSRWAMSDSTFPFGINKVLMTFISSSFLENKLYVFQRLVKDEFPATRGQWHKGRPSRSWDWAKLERCLLERSITLHQHQMANGFNSWTKLIYITYRDFNKESEA